MLSPCCRFRGKHVSSACRQDRRSHSPPTNDFRNPCSITRHSLLTVCVGLPARVSRWMANLPTKSKNYRDLKKTPDNAQRGAVILRRRYECHASYTVDGNVFGCMYEQMATIAGRLFFFCLCCRLLCIGNYISDGSILRRFLMCGPVLLRPAFPLVENAINLQGGCLPHASAPPASPRRAKSKPICRGSVNKGGEIFEPAEAPSPPCVSIVGCPWCLPHASAHLAEDHFTQQLADPPWHSSMGSPSPTHQHGQK